MTTVNAENEKETRVRNIFKITTLLFHFVLPISMYRHTKLSLSRTLSSPFKFLFLFCCSTLCRSLFEGGDNTFSYASDYVLSIMCMRCSIFYKYLLYSTCTRLWDWLNTAMENGKLERIEELSINKSVARTMKELYGKMVPSKQRD